MEFKQVIGRRRSIRHFLPWKPVEREKIQVMLEAAHQSSCAVNASFLQVIVIERDKLPKETLERRECFIRKEGQKKISYKGRTYYYNKIRVPGLARGRAP